MSNLENFFFYRLINYHHIIYLRVKENDSHKSFSIISIQIWFKINMFMSIGQHFFVKNKLFNCDKHLLAVGQ